MYFVPKRLVAAGIFDLYERFVIAIITDHAGQRTMAQYPVHTAVYIPHNPLGLVAGLEYPLYRAGWAVDYQKLVADLANSAWFDSEYPAYRSPQKLHLLCLSSA